MKVVDFFKSSYEELKLVRWPTRKELLKLSLLVLGLSVGMGLFVAGADFVYTKLLEKVLA